ncbi:hypothetical protein AY601_5054 [Pedobacter cryoconitis]|uniref:Uncharacterized protein n=2 Tax=Pedobacter cryoconitis TaxID=188932 RepID=A0A127VKM9_9SPHI|nr:hypothetical protein AY601_5054 [Pedobacter cryoconitis]
MLLSINIVYACKQTEKSFREKQEELMEGKTDQELIQEIYNKPKNYKIVDIRTQSGIREDIPGGLGLKEGGVLQVMFYEGRIYIERFGAFSGSYERQYYSDTNGITKVTFEGEGNLNDKLWTGGPRINPQWLSSQITVTQSYEAQSNYGQHHLKAAYILRRL